MARIHYWQYIVDDQGRPLEDVDIKLLDSTRIHAIKALEYALE